MGVTLGCFSGATFVRSGFQGFSFLNRLGFLEVRAEAISEHGHWGCLQRRLHGALSYQLVSSDVACSCGWPPGSLSPEARKSYSFSVYWLGDLKRGDHGTMCPSLGQSYVNDLEYCDCPDCSDEDSSGLGMSVSHLENILSTSVRLPGRFF